MNVLLISTYELGHQPFGLASPKAWLERDGHSVRALDLAVEALPEAALRAADLIGFYLPMHTATRLALPAIKRAKRSNPAARVICYGLYAPLNADLLRDLGVEAVIGGEFEASLAKLARGEHLTDAKEVATTGPPVIAGARKAEHPAKPRGAGAGELDSAPPVRAGAILLRQLDSISKDPFTREIPLDRLEFLAPDRSDLPELELYAKLRVGSQSKLVAYTEASRGCKHLCRHCPVVPVYRGNFRVIQPEIVLADLRQQIARGATHVTFGDPDFFNGPTHARRIVTALNREFPQVTYDATIKIEHLLKHRDLLPVLRETGCLFITSAVESVDDAVLAKLEKNHTRRDFFEAAALVRDSGIALQPTFIAFTPWTTIDSYRDLLRVLAESDLVENVAPVQLALRLLITSGSRLLELGEIRSRVGEFDRQSLIFPWAHEAPEVDQLGARVFKLVGDRQKQRRSRGEIFLEICEISGVALDNYRLMPRATIPYLDEPWYC